MQLLQSAQPVHFLDAVNPDVLMVVSIVGMSLLTLIAIPVAIVFTCQWSAVRKREATVVAVQDMLEKGFTAEQIRDVLEAGRSGRRPQLAAGDPPPGTRRGQAGEEVLPARLRRVRPVGRGTRAGRQPRIVSTGRPDAPRAGRNRRFCKVVETGTGALNRRAPDSLGGLFASIDRPSRRTIHGPTALARSPGRGSLAGQ